MVKIDIFSFASEFPLDYSYCNNSMQRYAYVLPYPPDRKVAFYCFHSNIPEHEMECNRSRIDQPFAADQRLPVGSAK